MGIWRLYSEGRALSSWTHALIEKVQPYIKIILEHLVRLLQRKKKDSKFDNSKGTS